LRTVLGDVAVLDLVEFKRQPGMTAEEGGQAAPSRMFLVRRRRIASSSARAAAIAARAAGPGVLPRTASTRA
jgi:hypothetical protein